MPTINQSARDRASDLEQQIDQRRNALRYLEARAAAAVSPRDVALGNAKAPTSAQLAKVDDERRQLDLEIRGLIELRLEVEPDRLREELAENEQRVAEINAKGAPIKKRLDEIPAEMDELRFQLNRIAGEVNPYQTRANYAKLALSGRNTHMKDLQTRLSAG